MTRGKNDPCSAGSPAAFPSAARSVTLQTMLNLESINALVQTTVSAALKKLKVQWVASEPIIGSDGSEALYVTIVHKGGKSGLISGDDALDAMVSIQRALKQSGEERIPVIEFATEAEMATNGGH